MSARLKGILQYIVGISLGAGLLYLAFKDQSLEEVWQQVRTANPWWITLAMACALFSHLLRGWRWSMLLAASGHRVPVANTFSSVMVGYLVNSAVPRLGELSRCTLLLRSNRVPFMVSAGTVFTERAVDVFTMLVLVGMAFLLEFNTIMKFFDVKETVSETSGVAPRYYLLVLAALAVVLVVLFFVFQKKLKQLKLYAKVEELFRTLVLSVLSIRKLASPVLFIVLSLVIWLLYVCTTYFIFLALDETAGQSFYFAYIVTALASIAMVLPVPGGIGPYQYAVIETFKIFAPAVSLAAATSISILANPLQVLVNIVIGGLAYFYLINYKEPEPNDPGPIG